MIPMRWSTIFKSRWMALIWAAGIVSFVADMIVLAPVALWLGVVSRSTGRAAAAAIVRVMVLPWMIFAGLIRTLLDEVFKEGRR